MLLIKWMIGQNDQILLNPKVIIVFCTQVRKWNFCNCLTVSFLDLHDSCIFPVLFGLATTEIEIGESGAESNTKAAASTIPKIYLGLYEDILFLLVTSLENARKPLWYVYCEKIPINYCVTLTDMTKWPMCKLVNVFTVRLNHFTAYKRKLSCESKSLHKEQQGSKALKLHTKRLKQWTRSFNDFKTAKLIWHKERRVKLWNCEGPVLKTAKAI